jgi:membrane-bound lytic murein transglycosylase B
MSTKLFTLTLLTTTLFTTTLFAKFDNCTFKNKDYTDVCKKVVKNGVSYKYANQFLLSYFKTQKFDEISWKYLQPRHIATHRANEKKANNVLVKYVPDIVANLKEYKYAYDEAEKRYGVNREIIAAILMKETKLDKIKPTHDAFIVFNTMVVRTKAQTPREKWLLRMGKANMASIITHCYKKGLKPEQCNLPSSYAGAVGIPQFMPSSFIYVDSYKKGEVGDLTKMEDAILSAARFLNKKAGFETLLDWSQVGDMAQIEDDWYEFDFKNENTSFVYDESKKRNKKYNCFSCDKEDMQYLREYAKKIMRYNNSSNYSVGVLRLASDSYKSLNN